MWALEGAKNLNSVNNVHIVNSAVLPPSLILVFSKIRHPLCNELKMCSTSMSSELCQFLSDPSPIIALCVKGGTWIKRCKKLANVTLGFSSKKKQQFIFTTLFEFLMSQIFHKKKLDDFSAANMTKITTNVKKRWSQARWATIFCRMKIWTMPRKKAQNSVAQRDQL